MKLALTGAKAAPTVVRHKVVTLAFPVGVVLYVFTAATAAAWSLTSLLVVRFLFGAAEAGATPSLSHTFAKWIPASERARAHGFYFAGMSAGVALAPPLATIGLLHWGWRATFAGLGALGVLWAIGWAPLVPG